MDFKENWNALRRATPENYKEIALDVCVNNHGPVLPPQAFSDKNVEEIQTTLYIDAEEIPKRPNISILQDVIASTWRAMRRLGPVVHPKPEVASLSDIRRALDDVVMHCAAERDGNVVDVIEELDCVLWADAAREQDTQEFKNTRHDDLLRVICDIVDERLSGSPRVSDLQSRADAGCDVLIELDYPALKCGVQLKSWRDIKAEDFARNTLAQIQESRRHGLRRLYIVLCADLTDRSQKDKVGQLASRISQANDDYVRVIPSERAWSLLNHVPTRRCARLG